MQPDPEHRDPLAELVRFVAWLGLVLAVIGALALAEGAGWLRR